MKPNYTENEYTLAKSQDLLSCICYNCKKPFMVNKKMIKYEILHNVGYNKFCSSKCKSESQISKIILPCTNCGKEFYKDLNQFKKMSNHFCSRSCAAIFRNTHKIKGYRRSKLEIYLEAELKVLYPNLKMDFNQTDAIDSELDIYIPFLKLAFELNGIFHYEPIYGQDKLNQIQNNDNRKFQACIENGIELCIIDSSQQKYFKKISSSKYLKIITEIIDKKLCGLGGQ